MRILGKIVINICSDFLLNISLRIHLRLVVFLYIYKWFFLIIENGVTTNKDQFKNEKKKPAWIFYVALCKNEKILTRIFLPSKNKENKRCFGITWTSLPHLSLQYIMSKDMHVPNHCVLNYRHYIYSDIDEVLYWFFYFVEC